MQCPRPTPFNSTLHTHTHRHTPMLLLLLLLLLLMITRSLAHHSTLRRSLSKSSSIAIENQSLHRLMRRTAIYAHPPGFHFNYEKQLITPIRDLLFSFLLSLFFFFGYQRQWQGSIQFRRHDTTRTPLRHFVMFCFFISYLFAYVYCTTLHVRHSVGRRRRRRS